MTKTVHYDDNEKRWYALGTKICYKLRPIGETGWPSGTKAARSMDSISTDMSYENRYGSARNYFLAQKCIASSIYSIFSVVCYRAAAHIAIVDGFKQNLNHLRLLLVFLFLPKQLHPLDQ